MTPKEKYEKRLKWFKDRIGKIIFRNKNTCKCKVCESVYKNGLRLEDEQHASYVMDCEGSSWEDGNGLRYFDTKDEVIKFENRKL
jgi:hypothetical protein